VTTCITCEFTRAEHKRLASELALLREVLRALCGDRAEEIIRLMQSRVRALAEGPPALVEDLDRRFNLCLAVAVAESMTPLIAQLADASRSAP
jgi:hypothetical protein